MEREEEGGEEKQIEQEMSGRDTTRWRGRKRAIGEGDDMELGEATTRLRCSEKKTLTESFVSPPGAYQEGNNYTPVPNPARKNAEGKGGLALSLAHPPF